MKSARELFVASIGIIVCAVPMMVLFVVGMVGYFLVAGLVGGWKFADDTINSRGRFVMTPIEQCPDIYQRLNHHVRQLVKLLDAPEPGLWSWMDFVAREVKAIADIYRGEPTE